MANPIGITSTGHPFIDVGFATLAAFANRRRLVDLTTDDLARMADYIEANYVRQPLRNFLTMALTSNSWFAQSAYDPNRRDFTPQQQQEAQEKRKYWADRHLRQWQLTAANNDETCLFTGRPAATLELSGKLRPGRVGRSQMPLLQGDDAINFFINGDPGLPMAPEAILALQAMPLGCAKVGGGLLAVHSDDEQLTIDFAARFLQRNLSDVAKAQAAGEEKLPGSPRSLKTLLIETLAEIIRRQIQEEVRRERRPTVTAYYFNNGQNPSLDIYHLPLQITGFLLAVHTPAYRTIWSDLVNRSWQRSETPTKRRKAAEPTEPRFNYLYEDLFTLPAQAARFVRTYFLRISNRSTATDDPRREYSTRHEVDLVSWPLVELFVQEVMLMTDDRVAKLKELGDKLADYTRYQGGKRFFRQFFTVQRSDHFLTLLNKTNIDYTRYKRGTETLFDLDSFLTLFMEGEEVLRNDWRLMRDLVLIRMVEQLRDWIANNADAIPSEEEVATGEQS